MMKHILGSSDLYKKDRTHNGMRDCKMAAILHFYFLTNIYERFGFMTLYTSSVGVWE
jgi:hypothetical protein